MSGARRSLLALAGVALLASAVRAQTYTPYSYPTGTAGKPGVMRDPYATDPSRQMSSYNPPPYGGPQTPPGGQGYSQYASPPPAAPTVVVQSPQPSYMSAAPYYPGYGAGLGMAGAGPGVGYGTALQGLGSYTQASGQYWKDIEQARMSREDVKQKQIETKRQEVQWEMDYEKLRPTTQKMVRSERAAELEWARNDPPLSEIWSGKTFNVLLRSILDQPNPTAGPNIPLGSDIVKALNLNDQTTRANLSLTKDEGKIDWTESLQEAPFDAARNSFQKSFDKGIQSINSGEPINRTQLQELRGDLQKMDEKLDDLLRDQSLPPSRYMESRRLLNQLKETVNGMGNARVVRSAGQSWKNDVRTVAQLVGHCMRNGVSFGPAVAANDEPMYTAAYYAIRNYERGLVGNAVASTTR
jgi:hypothetical protein